MRPPDEHWEQMRARSFRELVEKRNSGELSPKTANQAEYVKSLRSKTVTFCLGPAGAGKTYLACGVASQLLRAGSISRIIFSRPLLECDEEVGILPGDLMEKVGGVMSPLFESLAHFLGKPESEALLREGRLAVRPLAQMRGATFRGAMVVLDEAQNCTYRQLKMFLTRFGEGSRVVVCGDPSQSDLAGGPNPLAQVVGRILPKCHPDVGVVRLGRGDIVRHPLVQWLDERLDTRPPDREEDCIPCPDCGGDVWFDQGVDLEGRLVLCPHCFSHVEMRDALGRLDPACVAPSPEELPRVHNGRKAAFAPPGDQGVIPPGG